MDSRFSRVHQFLALEYVTADRLLRAVQPRDVAYRQQDVDSDVPVLRDNILKPSRTSRLASIFAYGMGLTRFGEAVSLAPSQRPGYDFVLTWPDGQASRFAPIELREVNATRTGKAGTRRALTNLLDELEDYTPAPDLDIAVFMNSRGRFEYGPWLQRPNLPIHGVWLFGRLNARATEWFIYGNLCRFADLRTYRYPE